jgi:protoporphyrinogen oxidase
MQTSIVIIGAGPAGLTAAYLLAKEKIPVTVIETDPLYVGGIARTVIYKGYCFDIGGHRFFSKSKEVEDFWTEILPNDMLVRPRSSRIFYKKKFFSYPLKFFEVLSKLGVWESFICFLSYLKARVFPVKNPVSFSDWVSNHFGKRLFSIFFKTYTEKVWGMPSDEISADWAAQRIKGLSLMTAVLNAIIPKRASKKNGEVIKTLIDSFRYPRKGPGMLWEECANKIRELGGDIKMGNRVIRCEYNETTNTWQTTYQNQQGETQSVISSQIISTAAIRELVVDFLAPSVSPAVKQAASALKYRDFLIVVLILKDKNQFSDNWIYIHDPSVDVARIQNFKSWSPEMVPDPSMCCYGMEYFCFEGDGIWEQSDEELIAKAKREIIKIGLASLDDITDGCVVRQIKAYPVYDEHYKEHVDVIRHGLGQQFKTLHLIGRNGMHKYNNQDHAMMTAMLTVKNILAEQNQFDVWNVNQDAEYHEAGNAGEKVLSAELGLREVPNRI